MDVNYSPVPKERKRVSERTDNECVYIHAGGSIDDSEVDDKKGPYTMATAHGSFHVNVGSLDSCLITGDMCKNQARDLLARVSQTAPLSSQTTPPPLLAPLAQCFRT